MLESMSTHSRETNACADQAIASQMTITERDTMRKPLIAGNWKMNKTVERATELVEGLLSGVGQPQDREVLVCPTFTALHAVGRLLKGTSVMLGLGAWRGDFGPCVFRLPDARMGGSCGGGR